MKIYWVLFSSCLTTSCEASWILNSAGNTAHLLFLKVSTVWNGRISLLQTALLHTDWGFLLHFPFCPGAEAASPRIIRMTTAVLPPPPPPPVFEPCWYKSLMGAAVQWHSCISLQGNNSWVTYLAILPAFLAIDPQPRFTLMRQTDKHTRLCRQTDTDRATQRDI